MPQPTPAETEKQLEQTVGNLLRAGVLIAATVVLGGGLLYLAHDSRKSASESLHVFKEFKGEQSDLRSPWGIVKDAWMLNDRGLIQLGLLLLIATPVARVFFSLYSFARLRDSMYVVFTLIVLVVLLYSLFFGYTE